jgi:hypothetical protein
VVASKLPHINLFLRNTEQYNHSSYNSFKIVSLYNYTLPAGECKCLGLIPGSNYCESLFSSYIAFSIISHKIKKIAVPSRFISEVWTGKNQLKLDQKSMGDAPLLSRFYFVKKSLTKTDRCVGACSEGEINYRFSICRGIVFWLHP